MKTRTWNVALGTAEYNFSGLDCYRETPICQRQFAPTVENVRRAIRECFPSFEIEETWETVKEQISDTLELGFFSISLKSKDDFITHLASFDEA